MPTKHRRIAITLDPELNRALERARDRHGAQEIDSSLIRAVLMRSPDTLPFSGDEELDEINRWVASLGGTPAVGRLAEVTDKLSRVKSERSSEELIAEQRRERP